MNLQPKILELLNKRGYTSDEDLEEFLSDKPQRTYDPFLLLNMEAGVDLILSTIDEGKKICIYGDYDADGITSTTILMEVLGHLTDNLEYYIPSRFTEGYGLNIKAIDKIKQGGAQLIVTVDCGSVSYEEVEHAKEIGLDIVVTDHHNISDQKADCILINPHQSECQYPFKDLAGCGVAFKLAQAIINVTGLPKIILNRTLDLVGIGTIGDIVPLVDENRTLAKYGIRAINTGNRKSLNALIEGIGLHKGNINSENVSFAIVPHLNATGRMKEARIAVELLQSTDTSFIEKLVGELVECNTKRKTVQNITFEKCDEILNEKYIEDLFYLIDIEEAHEGITGIVAGKIKEKYYRPTVIVTPTDDDCYKGTGRSIDGVNIYDLLNENAELFERFGGHSAACGFTIKKDKVAILRRNLNASMTKIYEENPEIFTRHICADLELTGSDVTLQLVQEMAKLEPCGSENPFPLISVEGIPKNYASMGNQNQYRRFSAILDNHREIGCVIFNNAQQFDSILQNGNKVSIIGTLGSKMWNGNTSLQINVETIKE